MLRAETVVVPPQHNYPFYVTAKRYPHPAFRENTAPQHGTPLILLFLHSTSFHKEIYEPVLEGLWARTVDGALNIREAWAIECPNHGESAVLNQDVLRQPQYAEYFSCKRYAEAVCHFMRAEGKNGPHIDMNTNRIAAIGHSLGGVAAVILSSKLHFAPLIIIDPFLFPGKMEDLLQLRQSLVNDAHERRDTWSSRQEAAKAFASKKNCRSWDKNVLKLYIQHGLREHSTANHVVSPYRGVTLACTREQEAAMYRDTQGAQMPIAHLDVACRTTDVHIAFGNDADIIPRYVQENLVDVRIRRFASVTWIAGAGHLVPQQAPQAMMEVIHKALSPPPRSRL